MSERARRKGFTISPSELAAYAADEVDVKPSGRQLRALAAALDIRHELVVMAASRQFTSARWARRDVPPDPAPGALVRDTHTPRRSATTRLRADGKRFLFARVTAGVAVTLSCVVLTYFYLLSVSEARIAFIGTIAFTGAPVVFLTIRLVIYLNAQERRSTVTFWPPDRSTVDNMGLALLVVDLVCVAFMAFTAFDELMFDGQLGTFLDLFLSGG